MTQSSPLTESSFTSLVRCLQTIVDRCPAPEPEALSLHRLRDLIQVLQTKGPMGPVSTALEPSLEHALTLSSTSQHLLTTLEREGDSRLNDGELGHALAETLVEFGHVISASLRSKRADQIRGLYVIIDPQVTAGRDPMEIARAAVDGGARMLQLRDKLRDKGESLPLARELQELCKTREVLLIINDHVDLAKIVGSAGVHVGQTDLPVAEARRVLAPEQLLGRSNHEIEELIESQEMGADHVAFGAIYQSGTKGVGRPPQGMDQLRRARAAAKVPLVAIGGITAANVAPVVDAGADAICVTAAVGAAPDPKAAAAALVEAISKAGGKT